MLAEVPEGWRLMRIGDALGLATRKVRSDPNHVYRLLGVRLYGNGAFLREHKRGGDLSTPYVYEVRSGDLVFSRLFASKGTFCIIGDEHDRCHTSNEFPSFLVKENSNCSIEYIRQCLIQPRMWSRVEAFCTGTTTGSRFRLNEKDFLKLPICLPKIEEQNAIISYISALSDTEQDCGKEIESLKKAKFHTLRQLLTLGISNEPTLKTLPQKWILGRVAENITQIPADWSLVRLTSVAKLETGHTPSRKKSEYWEDGDIPWISLRDNKNFDTLKLYQTKEQISPLGLENSSARLLPEGTIALCRTTAVGNAVMLGREMATCQDFANWVCGPELSSNYLLQVFRHMQREWTRLAAGSAHQSIYMPTFKKLQILLPPLQEQIRIAEIGEAFDLRIEAETAYLAELKKTKQALAQELLSGRVRLPQSMIDRFKKAPEIIAESAA